MQSVFVVSGDKNSGKTTFIQSLVTQLQLAGISVSGFIAPHDPENDMYFIQNVRSNENFRLMKRRLPPQPWPEHFEIFEEGLSAGNKWIDDAMNEAPGLFVIDEIGAFELDGRMWHNGFSRLVSAQPALLFSSNTRHLNAVCGKWDLRPSAVFSMSAPRNPNESVRSIKKMLFTGSERDF